MLRGVFNGALDTGKFLIFVCSSAIFNVYQIVHLLPSANCLAVHVTSGDYGDKKKPGISPALLHAGEARFMTGRQ